MRHAAPWQKCIGKHKTCIRRGIEIEVRADKASRYSGRFICLTVGLCCLFVYSFLLTVGAVDRYFGKSNQNPYLLLLYLAISVAIVLALPLLRQAEYRRTLCAMVVGLAVVWAVMLLYIYYTKSYSIVMSNIVVLLGIAIHVTLLFMWNLHFTLNKVEDVGMIIWVATVASGVLLFLYLNSSFLLPIEMVCVLPVITAVCCWWVEHKHNSEAQSEYSLEAIREYDRRNYHSIEGQSLEDSCRNICWTEADRADINQVELGNGGIDRSDLVSVDPSKIQMLFFSFRIGLSILLGIASGTFSNFYELPETNNLLVAMLGTTAVVTTIALLIAYRDRPISNHLYSTLPFVTAAAIMSVFLWSETAGLSRVAIGLGWTVCHVFTLTELPTYREMTRMEPLKFAVLEKACCLIPYCISAVVTSTIVISNNIYARYAAHIDEAVVYYMLLMVVIFGTALTRHIVLYFPRQQRPAAALLAEQPEELDDHVSEVAKRCSLTKREEEVLRLLAKGYSRPYIEKKLFISKGTAKTHIFRIFQKLNVSSQDELIELVEKSE